jgi:hypothetical protein
MPTLKKTLFAENLEKFNVLVQDTDPTSRYFKITELSDVFTGGKNGFLIQGSPELVSDTIIKIEIKDALGNVIYHEPGEGIPEYYEGTSKVVAVYIYPDTAFGPCTITILGELKEYVDSNGLMSPIPVNWEGQYNVKWQKQINVNPALSNTSKIRFYRRPKIDITESVLPVYNRTVFSKTISGSINATPINPISGSDYRLFKGILQYELSATSSIFSQSMENETITITGLATNYTPTITDVTTDKKAFVNIPYYITSSFAPNYYSIAGFNDKPFTLTFDESENLSNSNVSSSFAVIKITDLESFTGDPARIKVYASSRQDLGDYQLLEDIQIESTEVFLARQFENQLNVRTGIFTTSIIDNFWKIENLTTTATATLDNSALLKSVKLLPATDVSSSVGLFKFYNSGSIDFSKNTEYALDFTPLLVSASFYGKIEVYGSGSAFVNTNQSNNYGKLIGYLEAPSFFKKYDKQQFNFKSDNDGTGNISFVIKGGVWQLTNISLRAAHESAFSPNEVTLIADVPTKINNETFDFRFEIYDLNNNYVPVLLEKTFTFTGGNDIRIKRDLTINTSVNQFNFTTSSAFPSSILIDYTTTGLTGSITFYSQAVDTTGAGITTADLTMGSNYPGLLEYVDIDTKKLTINAFTGSLSGGKKVAAITYTASVENINRYFTIYRAEQGAPSYLFYATADKNNFTFDPDDNYKSVISDDYIDIRLVKQNLPSLSGVGLTIYSGSESYTPPALTSIGSIGNASIYRLYATSSTHPSSVDGYYYNLGQSHYDFELNTIDGVFTSSVTIDAIAKGDKGKGLFASADRNQFFYKMTDLTPTPGAQISTILVKRQNLGSQTSTITVTSGSGKPPLTLVSNNLGNGVAQYTVDTTAYAYTNGETKYTFSTVDLNNQTYPDEITLAALIAEAQISVNLTNENASLPAYSTGFVPSGSFVLSSGSVSVKVAGEDITRNEGLGTYNRWDIISATETGCVANDTTPDDEKYSITRLDADSGSLSLVVRYKDGRGTTTDITKVVSYSKAKAGVPNIIVAVSPAAQTIASNSRGSGSATPSTLTVTALEGGTSRFTSIGTPTYTNGLSGNVSTNTIIFTSNASSMSVDTGNVTIPVNYTDSEGTTGTKNVVATVSKSRTAPPTTIAIFSKESQSITKTNTGTYGTPATFTITVNEGGSNYTYSTGGGINTWYLSAGTGGTNSSGTITPNTPTTDAGVTVSGTITYVNSEGTTGTITKEHKVNVTIDGNNGATGSTGASGSTGPGVVFTGPWEVGRSYQFTSGSIPGRRDVVIWSATGATPYTTYYANKRAHTALAGNVADGAPNQGSSTAWESLGTQDFFVAAKIGLFEDSYVQSTLNIGTTTTGSFSTANITLYGGSNYPYFSLGQTTAGQYDSGGIFIGRTASDGKFKMSIKNATNYIRWTGDALQLSGSITATDGAIGGWIIDENELSSSTAAGGGDGQYTTAGIRIGSAGYISAQSFYLSSDGAASFSGSITANDGTIGGWTIAASKIYVPNNIELDATNKAITLYDTSGIPRVFFRQSTTFTARGGGSSLTASTGSVSHASTSRINGFTTEGVAGTIVLASGKTYNITSTLGTITDGTTGLTLTDYSTYQAKYTYSVILKNTTTSAETVIFSKLGTRSGTTNVFQFYSWSGLTGTNSITGDGSSYQVIRRVTIGWNTTGPSGVLPNPLNASFFQPSFSLSAAISDQFVEIIAGGIQVARDTDKYVVIPREGVAAQLQVGGEGTFTGDVTANTSDKRLKTNIINIDNPLEKLSKINGVYFNWNNLAKEIASKNINNREVGFLAQEIQEILPEIIKRAPFDRLNGEDASKTGENYLTIQYEKIVPLLVEAIKELKIQIDELKNR